MYRIKGEEEEEEEEYEYLLCYLNDSHLVCWDLPHGLEDGADVVTDRELIVELAARARCFDVCRKERKTHQEESKIAT